MKILFWILAILSIPVSAFISFVCYMSYGLGLSGTWFGTAVCFVGMFSLAVSIVCAVLGILALRKGNCKKAVVCALAGFVFSGIILAGYYLDDAVDTMLLERDIAQRNEQTYGENWNGAPAIEGIPEHYQELLNKYYVAIREEWPADQLMGLDSAPMADYYGGASLDNIGFALLDVTGDGVDELLLGTTAPVEEGGTVIFNLYSDPQNPFTTLSGVEGDIYYLHPGETAGTHMAEISGKDTVWMLSTMESSGIVGIDIWEGTLDPAGRLPLEMIPFSQYK